MKRIAIIAPCILPVPATKGGAVETLIQRILDDNELNNDCLIDLFTISDDESTMPEYRNTFVIPIAKSGFVSTKDRVSDKIYRTLGGSISARRAFDAEIIKAFRARYYELSAENETVYSSIIVENIASTALEIVALRRDGIIAPTYFHVHNEVDIYRSVTDIQCLTAAGVQFIAVSKFIASEILKADSNALVKVLYNGVDFEKFCVNPLIDNSADKMQYRRVVSENPLKFLYTGRIIPSKGVLELLKAYIDYIKQPNIDGSDTHLDIVGFGENPTEYESQVIHLARKYEGNVTCYPKIAAEKMPAIYRDHSAVFMPTLNEEPFGLVALEAMACGCPLVVTNSGGLLEVVDEESAICVKKSEIIGGPVDKSLLHDGLVTAFEALHSNEKRLGLSQAGIKRTMAIPEFNLKRYEPSFMGLVGVLEEKNSPLISVIITAYNLKDYISKAIESALNQTYQNVEVIIIDDGSTDGTEIICDKFADKYEKVKVLHQKNASISVARNNGINAATGDYIFFLDGDDYIDSDTLETLLPVCQENSVDIACCGSEMVFDDGSRKLFTSEKPAIYSGRQSIIQFMMSDDICTVVWNKLYRASLWNEIKFPEGKLHEDEATVYKVLDKAKIVYYIPKPLYKYTQRKGSIMHEYKDKRIDDFINAIDNRIVYFKDDKELLEYSVWVKLGHLKYFYRENKDKETRRKLARLFDDTIKVYGIPSAIGVRKEMGLFAWKVIKY